MSKFDNSEGNNIIKVKGDIDFKLLDQIKKNEITKYKLHTMTGIRYDTINNYCKGNVTLINKEYLKIFCNVLNCDVGDIIEYKK